MKRNQHKTRYARTPAGSNEVNCPSRSNAVRPVMLEISFRGVLPVLPVSLANLF